METGSSESDNLKEKVARTSDSSKDPNVDSNGDGVKRKKEADTSENCSKNLGEETALEGSKETSNNGTNHERENKAGESMNSEPMESQSEATEAARDQSEVEAASVPAEMVHFTVTYNKTKYDVTFDLNKKVSALREHIETITGVPPAMQKLMYKGLVKDDKTLKELKVTKGAKFMLVGSSLKDVLKVNKPVDKKELQEAQAKGPAKEPLCKQKLHKKVLDKGKPEDIPPGIKNVHEPLPNVPISGMINKTGGKVRLTFKLEIDQVWIGTKERTEKIPMSSIKNVVSEPIEGHEEYHIMGIQLGTTEASRYWIYWVPAQYVNAVKDTILGKWQFF